MAEGIRAFRLLRRWWWLLLAGFLIGGGVGFVRAAHATPIYEASARLLVNQAQGFDLAGYQDVLASEQLAKTYGEVLGSQQVLEETIKQLGLPLSPAALRAQITVRVIRDTSLLEVVADDPDPARAAAIANQLARSFIDATRDMQSANTEVGRQEVARELAAARQRMDATAERLSQLRAAPGDGDSAVETLRLQTELPQLQANYLQVLEAQQRMALASARSTTGVLLADPARVPTSPTRPQPARDALLAALVGLMLALGPAMLIEYVDDRPRDPASLRQRGFTPLGVLGTVASREGGMLIGGTSPVAQRFADDVRLVRANLDALLPGQPTVICVSSASPSEGKTTFAANLALVEAQAGKRVVLIDANLRAPRLHRLFGLDNTPGLSRFLTEAAPRPRPGLVANGHEARALAPVGASGTVGRVGAQRLGELVDDLRIQAQELTTMLNGAAHAERPELHEGPFGLKVLTAGSPPDDPVALLGTHQMAELLGSLRLQADLVLLDAAPILSAADALVLQRAVDGTVLVLDARRTGTRALEEAAAAVQQASGSVLGVVLNMAQRPRPREGFVRPGTFLPRPRVGTSHGVGNARRGAGE